MRAKTVSKSVALISGAVQTVVLCGVSHAQTQTSADEGAPLEQIIVTAQRRAERLQDVPMSVTALPAEALQDRGITNLQDLSNATSGVQINYGGAWTAAAVRGVTAPSGGFGTEGNVGLFIDGFYQPDNAGANAEFNNIDSIQVLKGPQGTLYGRNSSGGAILITTRKPSDTLTGALEAKYGSYDDASLSGYLSGPISDAVRYSVSLYGRETPGYYDLLDAQGNKIDDDIAKMSNFTGRAKLEADITSNLLATVGYNHVEFLDNRGNMYTPEENIPPSVPPQVGRLYQPFTYASNRGPGGTRQFFMMDEATLTLRFTLPIGTLTSYTGYAERDVTGNFDFDASYADLNYTLGTYGERSTQQAIDLTLDGLGNWDVIVGATYWDDTVESQFNSFANNAPVAISRGNSPREAWAAFVDATYHFTDRLHLNLGGRYTEETVRNRAVTLLQPSNTIVGTPTDAESSYTNFSPRGSLRYALNENSNVYVSVAEGFRAGGVGSVSGLSFPIRPETVTSYELGYKTRAAQGAVQFDTAAFYYEYEDLQVSALIPAPITNQPASVLINATTAEIYGAEAQLTFKPIDNLSIDLSGTWLHARYGSFPNATGVGVNPVTGLNVSNQAQDLSGKQMIRAPDFSGALAVSYAFDNVFNGNLVAQANLKYTDSYVPNNFSLDSPNGEQRLRQSAFSLVNATLTWTDVSDRYLVSLWGTNLTDEKYRLSYNAGSFGTYGIWGWPRQVGIRVGYQF